MTKDETGTLLRVGKTEAGAKFKPQADAQYYERQETSCPFEKPSTGFVNGPDNILATLPHVEEVNCKEKCCSEKDKCKGLFLKDGNCVLLKVSAADAGTDFRTDPGAKFFDRTVTTTTPGPCTYGGSQKGRIEGASAIISESPGGDLTSCQTSCCANPACVAAFVKGNSTCVLTKKVKGSDGVTWQADPTAEYAEKSSVTTTTTPWMITVDNVDPSGTPYVAPVANNASGKHFLHIDAARWEKTFGDAPLVAQKTFDVMQVRGSEVIWKGLVKIKNAADGGGGFRGCRADGADWGQWAPGDKVEPKNKLGPGAVVAKISDGTTAGGGTNNVTDGTPNKNAEPCNWGNAMWGKVTGGENHLEHSQQPVGLSDEIKCKDACCKNILCKAAVLGNDKSCILSKVTRLEAAPFWTPGQDARFFEKQTPLTKAPAGDSAVVASTQAPASQQDGAYFVKQDPDAWKTAMGSPIVDNAVVPIIQYRGGAEVWRGDVKTYFHDDDRQWYGRRVDGADSGQWKVGDVLQPIGGADVHMCGYKHVVWVMRELVWEGVCRVWGRGVPDELCERRANMRVSTRCQHCYGGRRRCWQRC